MMLDTEQLCDLMLVNMGADDAKTTDDGSRAGSDISLTGNVIKVDPFTVSACDDTFSAQHDAVLNSVLQFTQASVDFILGEFLCSFATKALKDLVSMMVVIVTVVMVMIVMASAGTMLVMLVLVVMVLVVMLMLMIMIVVLVMMLMLMVFVVMLVLMFMLMVFVVMLMIMIATTVTLSIMMVVMRVRQTIQFCLNGILTLHGFK